MTVINQNIVSFRCHRSMVSWVDTVAPLFQGGRSGFLRLLLIRVALEQTPPARGIRKLFKKEQQLSYRSVIAIASLSGSVIRSRL